MKAVNWENTDPLFEEGEIENLLDGFIEWDEENEVKKCECGSSACGSPKHSKYCPKYDKL